MDDWKEWVKDFIGVVSLFGTFYILFFFAGELRLPTNREKTNET